jgi:DNA polymerase III sliding clamp (beta) subunit (PCNA family)
VTLQAKVRASDLLVGLKSCAAVSDSALPILSSTLLSGGDGITLTATNTMQTVSVTIPGVIDGSGCYDTASLSSKASSVKPDAEIILDNDDISSGRTKWRVPMLAASDFPIFLAPLDAQPRDFSPEFMAAFKLIKSAVDVSHPSESVRGILLDSSIMFGGNGKMLRLIEIDPVCDVPVILPLVAMDKAAGMFTTGRITVTPNEVEFAFSNLLLRTRTIDVPPIRFRDVMGRAIDGLSGYFEFDKADMVSALSRALAMKSSKDSTPVQLSISRDEIGIYAKTSSEDGYDFCPVERLSGDDLQIGFNGAWLLSSVQSLNCERISCRYGAIGDVFAMRPALVGKEDLRIVVPRAFM